MRNIFTKHRKNSFLFTRPENTDLSEEEKWSRHLTAQRQAEGCKQIPGTENKHGWEDGKVCTVKGE